MKMINYIKKLFGKFYKRNNESKVIDVIIHKPNNGSYSNYHESVDKYFYDAARYGISYVYFPTPSVRAIGQLSDICASIHLDTINRIKDSDLYECKIEILNTPKGDIVNDMKKTMKIELEFDGYVKAPEGGDRELVELLCLNIKKPTL